MYLSFLLVCLSVCPVHYHYISTVSMYIYIYIRVSFRGCGGGGHSPPLAGCLPPPLKFYYIYIFIPWLLR